MSGAGAVNEAAITGESLPIDKEPEASVLAGTLLESGALDIRTDRVGLDTLFARIVALVEEAGSEAAPVQKLADRVAAWLLPVVLVGCRLAGIAAADGTTAHRRGPGHRARGG